MEVVDNAIMLAIPGRDGGRARRPALLGQPLVRAAHRVRRHGPGQPLADRARQGPLRGARDRHPRRPSAALVGAVDRHRRASSAPPSCSPSCSVSARLVDIAPRLGTDTGDVNRADHRHRDRRDRPVAVVASLLRRRAAEREIERRRLSGEASAHRQQADSNVSRAQRARARGRASPPPGRRARGEGRGARRGSRRARREGDRARAARSETAGKAAAFHDEQAAEREQKLS